MECRVNLCKRVKRNRGESGVQFANVGKCIHISRTGNVKDGAYGLKPVGGAWVASDVSGVKRLGGLDSRSADIPWTNRMGRGYARTG